MVARFLVGAYLCGATMACTRAIFVPPAGPGAPAPEAATAWAEATAGCRDARSYVAALRVSGRVGAQRLWPVSIDAAVTADQSVYLGATAAGNSLFVLAGTGNRATLWLRREQRTVTATPAEIMEAIVGVPLSPDQLLAVLTGCVARSFDITRATRHGRLLAIETADARVYLQQDGGRWRSKAAETGAFTVEFAAGGGAPWPKEVWIWSIAGRGRAASLHLTVSDAEINGQVPPQVFRIPAAAAAATPITIEELKAGGPWKGPVPDSRRSPSWPVP